MQGTTKINSKLSTLLVGALGVVFGDIGTSPLYAFREALTSHQHQIVDPERILCVLSLILWTIIATVSIKYVSVIMQADNDGEGGILALLALVSDATRTSSLTYWATILGLWGAAFFLGDCMLTPAISVLSAVEGIKLLEPGFDAYVIPLTVAIIFALFCIQSHGTHAIGRLFGPIMFIWFVVLALLGLVNIAASPQILYAINPFYGLKFLWNSSWESLYVLGSVFLAVTGGEALYADMGHFGKYPIRLLWFAFVFPALLLNYFGQGALLMQFPEALENPFYLLAPVHLQLPLLMLATAATMIASQAVISGAFSIFRQAVQLDYFPRLTILHTSLFEEGQIYVPFVNWILYFAVTALVLFFKTSSHLAAAYGIAVAATMIIATILVSILMLKKWRWSFWAAAATAGPLFLIDLTFLLANGIKIPHGGWFSLLVGVLAFTLLSTWWLGRKLVYQATIQKSGSLENFIQGFNGTGGGAAIPGIIVPGVAVVLTGNRAGVPLALASNYKHNHVRHATILLLTIVVEDTPVVERSRRLRLEPVADGFYRLTACYGFMQSPHVPRIISQCATLGLRINMANVSFFLSRSGIIPTSKRKMAAWRKHLFAFMNRNSTNAADFFRIPSDRAIEIGARIEI